MAVLRKFNDASHTKTMTQGWRDGLVVRDVFLEKSQNAYFGQTHILLFTAVTVLDTKLDPDMIRYIDEFGQTTTRMQ